VPAAAVETSADLLSNPQLAARDYWSRLDHPVLGSIVVHRVPFRSVPPAGAPRRAAPLLGEHTREIAASVLGIEGDAYEDLVAREVFV
jgi:crotonobetainyl-CoA:carnitine CoA-transferase CaiB-like acyl-CoA transferase